MPEIKTAKIDGFIVTVPAEEVAYLIVETPIKGKEIIPFEKVPLEVRIPEALERIRKTLALSKKEEVV